MPAKKRTTLNDLAVSLDGLNTKLDRISVTLDGHTATLDAHTATLDAHTATLDAHTATLDAHTATLDAHTARLDAHTKMFGVLDAKIDRVYDDLLGAIVDLRGATELGFANVAKKIAVLHYADAQLEDRVAMLEAKSK